VPAKTIEIHALLMIDVLEGVNFDRFDADHDRFGFNMNVDFGRTSTDYARHRAGFPAG
jgi:hypothetical protein